MCGLESYVDFEEKFLDCILPPALGGKDVRKVAETFGLNTESHLTIEWVKRYSHTNGDYKTISLEGKVCKPILELIDDLQSEIF